MQADREIINKLLNTMDTDAVRKLVLKLLEENLNLGNGNRSNNLVSGSGPRGLADPGLAPRPFRTFTMKVPEIWHTKIEKYVKTPESKYSKMSDLVREAIRQFIEEYNI